MCFLNTIAWFLLYQTTLIVSQPQGNTKTLADLIQPYQQNVQSIPCICIPLKNCPSLYEIISKHPVHVDNIEYLKNLTCGFDGLEPKVCCTMAKNFNKNQNSVTPPVQRRVFRCLASNEDNSISGDNTKDNDVKPNFYGKHPQHPPYFHHGYYPSRGFRGNPKFPPKKLLPNDDDIPNSNIMPGEASATGRSSIMRSKLLPDLTCGLSVDQRIVGGKKAKLGAYPWIARLGYTRPRISVYLYRCGGVLINTRFVLTAAHCIDDLPNDFKLATIRLGEMDERSNPDCEGDVCAEEPQDFTPLVIVAHRNYNVPKYKNDIGLIRLDREAIITPYVSPICLPYKFMSSINYTEVEAIAAGWGTVNIETSASSPVIQDVTLKISNLDDCKTLYSSKFQINVGESQICTLGQKGRDTCEGDSGGPLMRFELVGSSDTPRYFLIGIVSFGPKRCGTDDMPAVFTRVDRHLDWILYHIDDDFAVIN